MPTTNHTSNFGTAEGNVQVMGMPKWQLMKTRSASWPSYTMRAVVHMHNHTHDINVLALQNVHQCAFGQLSITWLEVEARQGDKARMCRLKRWGTADLHREGRYD